jgi:tetratricopeptide (TPR) repeat protein
VNAYYSRGSAYEKKGEYDQAIADFGRANELDIAGYTRLIELDPNDRDAYNNRGYAYDKKGEYDQAIADFDRVIELYPNDAGAFNHRGAAYGKKGETGRAIADFSRAIELNPNFAAPYLNRGIVKFNARDFKGASGDLLRSIELNDGIYAMLFRYLARARADEAAAKVELEANAGRLKTKEWPYAVIELYLGRRPVELTLGAAAKPNDRCQVQFYTGEWLILQNKPTEAGASLRKALEICSKDLVEYAAAQAELKRLKP